MNDRGLLSIKPVSDLSLLQEAQAIIHLGHPTQLQLKAAIADVLYVVGLEMEDLNFFVYLLSSTLTHNSLVETPVL